MNFLNRKSLLDRYMADVNSYLPLKNRKDIVEELRSNLSRNSPTKRRKLAQN